MNPVDMPPPTASDPVLPTVVVASPSEIPGDPDKDVTWWRPSWQERLRYLGYRWIFLILAALLIVLPIAAMVVPGLREFTFMLGVSAAKLGVPIGVSLALYTLRQAANARKEPFCIHCGYNLTGLPDNHKCPECGRPYTWRVIDEYRRDPNWFIHRWRERHKLPAAPTAFDAGPIRRKRSRDGT